MKQEKLSEHLGSTTLIKVQSVFSHLAASEDPGRTNSHCQQFNQYKKAADTIGREIKLFFFTAYHEFRRHFQIALPAVGYGKAWNWYVWCGQLQHASIHASTCGHPENDNCSN
jgi:hypothetical protein